MKTMLALLSLAASFALAQPALAGRLGDPPTPALDVALRLKGTNVLIFRPTRINKDHSLDASHLRLSKTPARANEKHYLQLVIYSTSVNQDGGNDVIFTDTQEISDGTSNTVVFAGFKASVDAPSYIEQDNRTGIIAVIIGFKKTGDGPYQPMAIPGSDTIAVEVNPPDGIGLLLPAVQKVRAAAARL